MAETINKKSITVQIKSIIDKQRNFFYTGETLPVAYRIKALKRLKKSIKSHEKAIAEALFQDFHKSTFETYISESGLAMDEIGHTILKLEEWTSPEKVDTPVTIHPGASYIHSVPYGTVLIIGAWNYPFQLTILPLIGAIAAGNTAIIKPSEMSWATSNIIAEIIKEVFDEEYVVAVEGGVEETQALLEEPFDYIFFTGSTRVGKIVAAAAAKHLTPTTLELGGKSPCIVDEHAQIEYTAKRITWGKLLNGGQTCVAPDFLLVHHAVKEELLFKMRQYIREFYGDNPQESPDYPRIINEAHFDRLVGYFKDGKIVAGGQVDRENLYIAPTIIDGVSWDAPIMQEEIFGPIMPVVTFSNFDEALARLRRMPKPLAAYLFAEHKRVQRKFMEELPFGGGCINDTITHFANPNLPFGGVGGSGSGAYHGKFSFDTFSHKKSIHKKTTWVDIPLRYPPYKGKIGLIKQLIN